MATKSATVESTMAKLEEAKKQAETKAVATEVKEVKETAKKEATPKKAAPKKETAVKKEAAPKKEAASKKAATPKKTVAKTESKFYIEFAGGQIEAQAIMDRAKEVCGKKTIKTLNVYYQPENGMVYFTADGEEGSFAY